VSSDVIPLHRCVQLRPGDQAGPYVLGEPLGSGGMGEVHRARDVRLDRVVAIKSLPAHTRRACGWRWYNHSLCSAAFSRVQLA